MWVRPGVSTIPALNRLRMKVVSAKAASPSGPGSAIESAAGRAVTTSSVGAGGRCWGSSTRSFVCLILRYSFRRHVALLGVKNWRPAEPALRAARLDRSPVARCGGSLCPLRRPFTARRTPVGLTQTTHPCGFVESARVRPCAPRSSGRRQQYQQQATFPRGPGTIPRSGSPEAGRPRGEQAPARRAYRPLWRCPAGRRVQIRVRVGAPTRSVRTVGQVGHPAPLAGEPG